jgi:hypothetical protein
VGRVVQHIISKESCLLGAHNESWAETKGEGTTSKEVDTGSEEPLLQIFSNFLIHYIEADESTITSNVLDVATFFLNSG